jgi:hypothetical protein
MSSSRKPLKNLGQRRRRMTYSALAVQMPGLKITASVRNQAAMTGINSSNSLHTSPFTKVSSSQIHLEKTSIP